ncbi:MAG: hypothetical protein UX15_C0007G0001, partial [Parcubacteria group bacterium GW2011_GWA1_45_7]
MQVFGVAVLFYTMVTNHSFLIMKSLKRKFDQQRISDLQNISSAVNTYYDRNKHLPGSLSLLVAGQDYYVF